MITCPRCSRANEPHYRFCLGCGFELASAGAGPDRPNAPGHPLRPSTGPAGMASGPFLAPPPDYPDPALDAGTHLGAPPATTRVRADPAHVFCRHCGNQVERGYAFCGACGKRVAGTPPPDDVPTGTAMPTGGGAPSPYPPAAGDRARSGVTPVAPAPAPPSPQRGQAPNSAPIGGTRAITPYDLVPNRPPRIVAYLVRIDAGGADGGSVALLNGRTPVGREHGGALFAQDLYLSPLHASFECGAAQVVVRDEGSLNGVFVRLKGEARLEDGDVVRVGQELLRFEATPAGGPPRAPDGTALHGSPDPGAWGRLVEVIAPDDYGNVYMLRDPEVVLGRAYGDVTFPDDAFVSGTHCRLSKRGESAVIDDLGSSNGTYLRLRGEATLADADLILLGQQLFRLRRVA